MEQTNQSIHSQRRWFPFHPKIDTHHIVIIIIIVIRFDGLPVALTHHLALQEGVLHHTASPNHGIGSDSVGFLRLDDLALLGGSKVIKESLVPVNGRHVVLQTGRFVHWHRLLHGKHMALLGGLLDRQDTTLLVKHPDTDLGAPTIVCSSLVGCGVFARAVLPSHRLARAGPFSVFANGETRERCGATRLQPLW